MRAKRGEHWRIADLPWADFEAAKVDPELLRIVKAAALVEYNADDYATYLANVFSGDDVFQAAIRNWALEERQHGEALRDWAQRADPTFDFQVAFSRFISGYRINVDADQSVRGSQLGELVSRCIVETGTSSYYTMLGDAADEPVLKALCRLIAADELRHYKLFYTHLKRTSAAQEMGRWARLKVALGRVQESEDDELAFAYFAANAPPQAVFDRAQYSSAYLVRAFPLYRPAHFEQMIAMISRVCGLKLSSFLRRLLKRIAQEIVSIKIKRAHSVLRQKAA